VSALIYQEEYACSKGYGAGNDQQRKAERFKKSFT
jgi:hypothetical protein